MPHFARRFVLALVLLCAGAVHAQNTPVILTMWHIATEGDPFRPVLQGAIERFNAAYTDVRIEARAVDLAGYQAALDAALASGQGPDIFQTWGGGLLREAVRQGWVRPVDALSSDQGARFFPEALAPATFDGQPYAVPANLAGIFLWYNRGVLAQHGVEPPATWDAFIRACETLRTAGVTPVALGNAQRWPGSLWYTYLVLSSGGPVIPASTAFEQIDLSNPAFVQAGERIQQAVQAGCFEPNHSATSLGDAQQLLGTGQAAMQLQGDWNLGGLRLYVPDPIHDHIGVLPFPNIDGQTSSAYLGGTGQAFAVAADAPVQAEGALVNLLTGDDYGRSVAEAGFIPALVGYDTAIDELLVAQMAAALRSAESIQLYYDQLFPPDVAGRHLEATAGLFALTTAPAEAVQALSDETPVMVAPAAAAAAPAPAPLRALAPRELQIGSAVGHVQLQNEPQYAEILSREFNLVTPETELKWAILRPDVETFNFEPADAIIEFAETHEMGVRGHTLIWHRQLPGWLEHGGFSRETLLDLLREHIFTVVGRYEGRIAAWDVVNEAFNDDGTLRDTVWLRTIGPEYIDYAFRWAHEADPDALLFYNDYNSEGLNAKSDAIYALVAEMQERGVPIHGVGLQMHISLGKRPVLDEVRRNIERLGALGLEVHITEMDVAIQDGTGTEEERLLAQAMLYGEITHLCLSLETCTALVFWGFTDRHTWIPQETGRADAPLLFDDSYQPKPAYRALITALSVTSR